MKMVQKRNCKGARQKKDFSPLAVILVPGTILLIVIVHLVDQDQKQLAATMLLVVLDSLQEDLPPDLGLVHQAVTIHQGSEVMDCRSRKMMQLVATMHLEALEVQEEQGAKPQTATMHQVDLEDQTNLGLE